ncbi:malate dehydrogenase [Arthrobacter sp. Soil782]|uniref:Ldh family oxidoreductase n=1 Tax=Arthrobacter sp. Soil782 TaxID=1736410 RepID=UPI0006FC47EC|nr:Ldh family oxidoreductase [Arthrobacter sp. Soil782]KRF08673.1 malate dehydrogenase [Arthrobacter sp. Soil782]
MTQYSAGTVRQQILAVLSAWGMASERAEITAEVMVDTDLAGIDSHGISMLPMYQRLIDAGKLDARAEAVIEREGASTAVVDGGHNLGHSAMVTAMRLAVSKARETGVGVVTVRRSHHFGAAGYYARIAAEAGQIGLVTSTTPTKTVVPTRGSRPVLGTNPLAFAAPSANTAEPFLLDMSTSTVAMNKVKVYDYLDKPLPAGWVLDGAGRPVTDSHAGYSQLRDQQEGGLSPLGGTEQLSSHKGYGLALMVQILAGALAGATFAPLREPSDPNDIGHFCLVIDPAFFGAPEQFAGSVSQIVDLLRAEPPAAADRPVLVPGDIERTVRTERLESGIPLSDGLVEHIRDICDQNEAPFHL